MRSHRVGAVSVGRWVVCARIGKHHSCGRVPESRIVADGDVACLAKTDSVERLSAKSRVNRPINDGGNSGCPSQLGKDCGCGDSGGGGGQPVESVVVDLEAQQKKPSVA